MSEERRFKGLGVSAGIAIGTAYVRESGAIEVAEYSIPPAEIGGELERLGVAVKRAQRQIGRLQTKARKMPGAAAEELGFLLEAYQQMLHNSRLVRGACERIKDECINAEAAVQREINAIAETFQAMDDAYIAARFDDIREVGNRLVLNLTRTPVRPFSSVPVGSIVIAEQLTPADMAQLDPGRVLGVATMLGGAESHTAIMARALRLPTVLGVPDLLEGVRSGEPVIVDGNVGQIAINPTPATVAETERQRDDYTAEARGLRRLRTLPAVSRDGTEIVLQANIELPIEMSMVAESGAEGIGLLRSEFMFMNREDLPTEEEQYEVIRDLVTAMHGQPVTIRSLDVGGDKALDPVTCEMDDSAASVLGLRGIRLSLAHADVLETQFRAMLQAANHGDVRILLPMVSTVSEVRQARALLKKAAAKLKRRRIKLSDSLPPLGVMIEVPGAALAADALAQASDFLAIGSNDLTMYTLAVDRANEHVAHLFDPLHPGVLRLIQFTAGAALRARIPLSICGEMAGDPRYTALLLGLGMRELSMTPARIARVKRRIREMDVIAASQRAELIMDQVDSGRIATLLDDFNALA
ncbi:MAG: Phosphoenolpyruvate-protein phosphotransferase [Alphaproteobacteria bacterium MarineAlpha3_Bin4]|nr:MAG: Phosphoenolpyruvate-protein phosphotransferase [Alphaproteobacteria bacterium MarineAlpha3_Bin4]